MSPYHLIHLDREAYIFSTSKIADIKTLNFSKMSLGWWDKHFNWKAQGCVVLSDADGEHLSYVFYKIDRYHQYMTIHNIFTPLVQRRNGYAKELLNMLFDIAVIKKVRRFKLVSVSKSLDFYMALGFVYWGLNSVGDYYCNLPVPSDGLYGLEAMTRDTNIETLIGRHLNEIYTKVNGNDIKLDLIKSKLYDEDKVKMLTRYRLTDLCLYHTNMQEESP